MLSTPTLSGLREAVSNTLENTHQHINLTPFLRRHVIFAVAWRQPYAHAFTLTLRFLLPLRPQVSEKYGMPKDNIGKIYKKCKRGWVSSALRCKVGLEGFVWQQGLICSFNLIVPSGEAHVDRLDGSVMECVNCSSFETGGCGRMERFQKSCRCVMADCCACLFSQPRLLGTSGEVFFW